MGSEQPRPPGVYRWDGQTFRPVGGPGVGRVFLVASAAVALLLIGFALGRAGASSASTNTGSSTAPTASSAYCTALGTLSDDLAAAKSSAGQTGAPNAYAAAEARDAGPIFDAAASSSGPAAARQLALALTLDAQARQQPEIDAGLLAKIESDTDAAVKTAPAC